VYGLNISTSQAETNVPLIIICNYFNGAGKGAQTWPVSAMWSGRWVN